MQLSLDWEREEEDCWLAAVLEIPGAPAYGSTHEEPTTRVKVLALRVITDGLEHEEPVLESSTA